MKIIPLERDILKTCLEWLNYQPGVRVWRQNTGSFKLEGAKARFFRAGSAGMADISGIGPEGRRIEIEVKRPGKVPTELQQDWLDEIIIRGGIAFWCDSPESCERKYRIFTQEEI